MTPKEFVTAFKNDAFAVAQKTGIHYLIILTQAALESGWGKYAPGNMFFGIKDTDGVNGNEQLITTTEYSTKQNLKFPIILSITPVVRNGRKLFKYKVKDYFRKYATPADSFEDHAKFFLANPRYQKALAFKQDPDCFFEAIAKAGYATAPDYASTLKKVCNSIKKHV